MLQTSVQYNTW